MEKVFVDTSAWIALFIQKDQYHEEAKERFSLIQNRGDVLFTSDYIIDETITTILRHSSHAVSVRVGDALMQSELIKIIPVFEQYFPDTWIAYKKFKDKEFSFTDVSSFVVMNKLKIGNVFTFDSDFLKAGYRFKNI